MLDELRASREWLRRAHRLVPAADAAVLLSPPLLCARFLAFALARRTGRAQKATADDVRARDPEFTGLLMDFFRGFGRLWFRPRIEGLEHLPAEGPALLVGNHNGGLVPVDAFLTGLGIWDHFAGRRAMYSMVHDFVFHDPLLRRYALKLGMLRAGDESARHAFADGHLVLVYPGSDLETFRPFVDRGKVILGGRTGFLALALRCGVPIVPVVSAGTQEQYIVLTRGDRIGRLIGMTAWARTSTFPLVLSMPWGLTSGFVPYLPLPVQTTVRFGEPIRWPGLSPADAERPEVLQRCYREVESCMQAMLDDLSAGRRFMLGKPEPAGRPRHAPDAASSTRSRSYAPVAASAAARNGASIASSSAP